MPEFGFWFIALEVESVAVGSGNCDQKHSFWGINKVQNRLNSIEIAKDVPRNFAASAKANLNGSQAETGKRLQRGMQKLSHRGTHR